MKGFLPADVSGDVAIRRFKRVMNLKIKTNNDLARALREHMGPGIDWIGSTKADMATCIALGGERWCTCPDPDGLIHTLEARFGIKDRKM